VRTHLACRIVGAKTSGVFPQVRGGLGATEARPRAFKSSPPRVQLPVSSSCRDRRILQWSDQRRFGEAALRWGTSLAHLSRERVDCGRTPIALLGKQELSELKRPLCP
jgi:hypothetical protein